MIVSASTSFTIVKDDTEYLCSMLAYDSADVLEDGTRVGANLYIRVISKRRNELNEFVQAETVARGRLALLPNTPPFPGAVARVWELDKCTQQPKLTDEEVSFAGLAVTKPEEEK